YAIRCQRQNLGYRRRYRNDRNTSTTPLQRRDDALLQTTVEHDDVRARAVDHLRLWRRDGRDNFMFAWRPCPPCPLDQLLIASSRAVGDEQRTHRPVPADMPGQGTGVDRVERGNAVTSQVLRQRAGRTPVARFVAILTHDQPGHPRPARLVILSVDAVVTDERVGQADELPVEGRIGRDLLVTHHAGREDGLPLGIDFGAEGLATEDPTVFEHECPSGGEKLSHDTAPPLRS